MVFQRWQLPKCVISQVCSSHCTRLPLKFWVKSIKKKCKTYFLMFNFSFFPLIIKNLILGTCSELVILESWKSRTSIDLDILLIYRLILIFNRYPLKTTNSQGVLRTTNERKEKGMSKFQR